MLDDLRFRLRALFRRGAMEIALMVALLTSLPAAARNAGRRIRECHAAPRAGRAPTALLAIRRDDVRGLCGARARACGHCLYSVMAYAVARRTRGLGVRIALGATRGAVLRLIAGQGIVFAAAGVALGSAVALGAARWVEPLLFAASPRDPVVYGAVALILTVVALAATLRRRCVRCALIRPARCGLIRSGDDRVSESQAG